MHNKLKGKALKKLFFLFVIFLVLDFVVALESAYGPSIQKEDYVISRSKVERVIAEGDGLSMNCTLGSVGNISINYERYNLTSSIAGDLSLGDFEANYSNLTSTSVVREFNLNYRQNDAVNEAINSTYWRIYVPTGVAGSCSGNIIFGATQSAGT